MTRLLLVVLSFVLAPGGRVLVVEFMRSRGVWALNPVSWIHMARGPSMVDEARSGLARAGFVQGTTSTLGFGGLGYARAVRSN